MSSFVQSTDFALLLNKTQQDYQNAKSNLVELCETRREDLTKLADLLCQFHEKNVEVSKIIKESKELVFFNFLF